MHSNFVIVDRRDGRVGKIESELSPSRFLVNWASGSTEEIKTGREFAKAETGSARYLQYTDHDRLLELATSSPLDFFKLVLAEQSRKGVTALQLKKSAVGYDVAKEIVDAGWKKVGKSLADDSEVRVTAEVTPRYSLRPTQAEPAASGSSPTNHSVAKREEFPLRTEPEQPLEEAGLVQSSPQEESPDGNTREEESSQTQPDGAPIRTSRELLTILSKERLTVKDSAEASKEFLLAASGDTDELLYSALTDTGASPKLIERVSRALPELCSDVAEYPEQVVTAAFLRSRAKLRQVLGAAIAGSVGHTKIRRSPEFKAFISSDVASRLFAQLVEQLVTRNDKSSLHAAIAFEGALFDAGRSSQTPTGVWIELLKPAFDLNKSSTQELRVHGLAAITEEVRETIKAGEAREQLPREAFVAIARAIQDLPFEKTGGRSAFVQVVSVVRPELVSDALWWVGFDVDALNAAGDGVLGSTLRLPDVHKLILEPLVGSLVEEAATRRTFAYLLSLPVVGVEAAGAAGLARSFRNATRNDRLLRELLENVSQEETIQALRRELDSAHANLEAASSELTRLAKERDQANEATDALLVRLTAAAEAQGGLRSQEKRQLQVDSTRALAQAVAMVESDAAKLEPHALIARLHSLLKRQGVEPIGVAREVVGFDPELHDSPGVGLATGHSVVVVRSGYRWNFKTEELVLLKALVAPSEE